MTPPTASSPTAATPDLRLRMRWENLAIVGIGLVVAAFAVVLIIGSGSDPAPKGASAARPDAGGTTVAAAEPEGEATSLEAALTMVSEATALVDQGRWDEAADKLALVPEEFRAAAGVDAVVSKLDARRADNALLRDQLAAAVEARQWDRAEESLASLAKMAPLDKDLLTIKAQVQAARTGGLAPSAPVTATDAPAATASGGGGAPTASGDRAAGVSTATPAPASTVTAPAPRPLPQPATSTPRPAAQPAPAAQGGAHVDVDAVIAQLGLQLTPAERTELASKLPSRLGASDAPQVKAALQAVLGTAGMAQLQEALEHLLGATGTPTDIDTLLEQALMNAAGTL